MNEPTCPKCGNIIKYWETVDEFTEVYTHNIFCIGVCPHCKTNYQWWEIYKFSHIEDLEES